MKIFDKITGKELDDRIKEYSEIYGEILLGLHQKVEVLENQLRSKDEELKRQAQEIEGLSGQLQSKDQELKRQNEVLSKEVEKLKTERSTDQDQVVSRQEFVQLRLWSMLSYFCVIVMGIILWIQSWRL